MRKVLLIALLICTLSTPCYAGALLIGVDKVESSITMHEWAHLGAGYIINDQLHRHTKLTPLERFLAVSFIGYAKEKWVDKTFTRGEFEATAAGGLIYNF